MHTKKFIVVGVMSLFVLGGCSLIGGSTDGVTLETQEYGGVLRSVDSGITFEPRSIITDGGKTLARMNVLSLVADPIDGRTIYAGTQKSGVYVTHDSGDQWEKLNFAPTYTPVMVVNPHHTQTLYASAVWDGRGRLFRTDDGGETWRDTYIEPVEGTVITAVALSPENPDTIYIGTSRSQQGFSTLARSNDGGETWRNIMTQNNTISRLAFDAQDRRTMYVYVDNNDIMRSRDGGATWENLEDLTREQEDATFYEGTLHSFVAHPRESGVLYVGTDEGLFQSRDFGVSWTEEEIIGSSKGLPIRGLALAPAGQGLLYVAGKAVYVRSATDGAWSITDTQSDRDVGVVMYDPYVAEIVYMGLQKIKSGGLF